MYKLFVFVLSIALCACSPRLVTSSDRTVIINTGSARIGDAQKLADQECGKHKRIARLTMKPTPNQYVFDCIE